MQQTQGYINQPMNVPLIIQPPQEHLGQKYAKIYFGLGVTQLVMGVLSLGIAITALCLGSNYYSNYYFDTGAGIWCGVFFLVCGILGCISGQKPGKCIIVASMVMTIISAVIATTMLSLETASALLVDPYGYYYGSSWALIALHSSNVLVAFIELVICIIHSAYCCAAVCCCKKPQNVPTATSVMSTQYNQMPTTYIGGQGQTTVYSYQYAVGGTGYPAVQTNIATQSTIPPVGQQAMQQEPPVTQQHRYPPPAYQATEQKAVNQ